jgi:hypothetical protein
MDYVAPDASSGGPSKARRFEHLDRSADQDQGGENDGRKSAPSTSGCLP